MRNCQDVHKVKRYGSFFKRLYECCYLLQIAVMKVVSLQLPSGPSMERLPLPFSPTELLWRYPLPWAPPPPSPLGDTKAQLPAGLPPEPRLWTREDVVVFLKWCEREFDLPNFDMDLFQMNGKERSNTENC